MDEATAYEWAGAITAGCTAEPHKTQQCADLIVSALVEEAAELERQVSELTNKNCELQEKLDEYENAYKFIMDDKCFNEEKHCACAPILRAKMKELEAENAMLKARLEPIEVAHMKYKDYPLSAISKRNAYSRAINQCMELKEGE